MAKRNTKKDPMHVDYYIELCKKDGNHEMAQEFREIKQRNNTLKKLGVGKIITFEELVKLPEGYKYVSSCSGEIDVEEMSDLEVKDGKIYWSQSSGDPVIEMGTGEVKNIPHCSDDEYEFTLYHLLPKVKKKTINRKLKSHPLEKKSVLKKIEKVIKK